jgi:hypothetical protein
MNYSFTAESGTFTPLSGGGISNALSSNTADDALSTAISIGFPFQYNCQNVTQFKVSSNGWMTFNTALTSSLPTNDLDGTGSLILAPLWDDLQCTNNVRYKTTGTNPNRVLTIEWLNMEWNYLANNPVISFQVKLYETSNIIEFIYRQEATAVYDGSASIGINGAVVGQFLSLNNTGASPTPSSVIETDILSTKPATGQIYRWTPIVCSGTPTAGSATATTTSSCGPFNTTLFLTGASTGCGLTYQWQSSPDNITWTNISGATSSTYNVTVTANTYYRCVVSCGANSSNSASVYLTINPTSAGTGTVLVSSLPYFSPARSTCGQVNDLTSSNVPVTCGSTSYLGGEDEVFIFTPTTSGNITIDLTNASTTWAGMKLYQGCPLSPSAICIGNASGSANLTMCVNVTSGTTYYLVVDVYPLPTCYTYDISITAPTSVSSGNTCADATIITALPYFQNGLSTCCKGNDYTSSNACSSLYMNGEDYVFRYTPPTNQTIDISLGGTLNYTGLFVTNGCPNTGTCVAFATSASGNPSLCGVNLTGGVTYYIIVDTWPSPNCTPFNIDIRQQTSTTTCNLAYTASSITYSPDSYTSGTSITFGDDRFSPTYIPIGFNFCFDGRLYTQLLVSSNGYLIFDRVGCTTNLPSGNATPDGFSPYSISGNAPNTTNAPRNVIMGPWQDIHPGVGGQVTYQLLGSAPNRRLVVSFYQVPMYSCNSLLFTGQIKLFETSNNIEIHLQNKPTCTSWNSGQAILGLHNYNGTIAVIPANRNASSTWNTSNEAWRFTTSCTTCVPLPVELIEFDGYREEGVNKLYWTTLTETNNDFFILERSEDAENFYEIAKIKGAGNSNTVLNYVFYDRNIISDVEYYRLKQTDFDGSYYYSHTIAISNKNTESFKIKNIYPNPTTEDFYIDVVSNMDENLIITLTDVYGKKLNQFEYNVINGKNTIKVNTEKIERGLIFVNITSANNSNINITQKIVKQ